MPTILDVVARLVSSVRLRNNYNIATRYVVDVDSLNYNSVDPWLNRLDDLFEPFLRKLPSINSVNLLRSVSLIALLKFGNAVYQRAARRIREGRYVFYDFGFLTVRFAKSFRSFVLKSKTLFDVVTYQPARCARDSTWEFLFNVLHSQSQTLRAQLTQISFFLRLLS